MYGHGHGGGGDMGGMPGGVVLNGDVPTKA